jgi:hypothetical protein
MTSGAHPMLHPTDAPEPSARQQSVVIFCGECVSSPFHFAFETTPGSSPKESHVPQISVAGQGRGGMGQQAPLHLA